MSKKLLMIVSLLLIILLLFSIATPIFASSDKIDISQITEKIDRNNDTATHVAEAAGGIIGIIQIVGTAVAIFMLIYIGIKYVIAAPSEKADLKKTAFIYVVAAIFIFAASNILGLIQDWSGDIFGNT